MSKILYLHGFGSCGEGNKSSELKKYFGENNVLSPDLLPSPLDAIGMIEGLLKSENINLIIGSSLGGFYATYLAEKYQMRAVLLNPSTQPWETLAPYVGWQKRFCDEEVFEFKTVYLNQLQTLEVMPENGNYLVLLQSEDEVLDYTKAQSLYNKHKVIVEYGGNHRFENIHDYMSMIENFI
ncbi:YqiA/YcfP family alpha/beta fold hydrolase [Sulfurovum sp.]|uniref:YqiA/YcfP family alpha/beta fold hydrolase n=1 Tax=Sulfurovum sp. TaxID=1969726 RepID=UPI00286807F4|nr:YqiA/YcfP family alpha/beta fold hydrolase [Sulfurovum sp.]